MTRNPAILSMFSILSPSSSEMAFKTKNKREKWNIYLTLSARKKYESKYFDDNNFIKPLLSCIIDHWKQVIYNAVRTNRW